jgi:hypothetical protein
MVDFSDIASLVADVITAEGLGAEIKFSSLIPGTYNPATGAALPAFAETTVQAIVEDFKGLSLMSGLIQIGDKKVSIPAASLIDAPKPGDKVDISEVPYFVERVMDEQAGGVAILHVLHCRRA